MVLVEGILALSSPIDRGPPSLGSFVSSTVLGLLEVGLGLVTIFASREVRSVLYDLALIVVGVISFESIGGFLWQLGQVLVILAGLVGVVAKFAV